MHAQRFGLPLVAWMMVLGACGQNEPFGPEIFVTPEPLVLQDGTSSAILTIANTGAETVVIEDLVMDEPLPAGLAWSLGTELPATFEPGGMLQVRLSGDATGWEGGTVTVLASATQSIGGCGAESAEVRVDVSVPIVVADEIPTTLTEPGCDYDGDGFLAPRCGGDDCNDSTATIYPGAIERCNGVDDDCDGTIDVDAADARSGFFDGDGDGYGAGDFLSGCDLSPLGLVDIDGDCDDNRDVVNPGASELCNGLDDDCDTEIDEGAEPVQWFRDVDDDGFGGQNSQLSCASPGADWVRIGRDCDDRDEAVNPDALEVCNEIDDNCDGDVDEGLSGELWFFDGDLDGFGTSDLIRESCTSPGSSWSSMDGDCDDDDVSVNPDAPELCDGLDNDCNALVDDNVEDLSWYLDNDGDRFGDPTTETVSCASPGADFVLLADDCDDANVLVNPEAAELCDALDNDCNGLIDDGVVDVAWYADLDADGYGDPVTELLACAVPGADYVLVGDDCDDTNPEVSPGAEEVCNDADDNCDGLVDVGAVDALLAWPDLDRDGFGNDAVRPIEVCALSDSETDVPGDCDDDAPSTYEGAPELCDGVDNDCNGLIDDDVADSLWYVDADGDGYGDDATAFEDCTNPGPGFTLVAGDCDDDDSTAFPGADEVCDGLDNDCNGAVDDDAIDPQSGFLDADGDSFGDPLGLISACELPVDAVANGDDCDDADAGTFPGAEEVCDNRDNDCDGAIDNGASGLDWFSDADSDGFGDAAAAVNACFAPAGFVADATDCNDSDASAFPGAQEVCDGDDEDCDGDVDEAGAIGEQSFYADADLDGFGAGVATIACEGIGATIDGDCDDDRADVFPGASEVCDGADQDCNGLIDDGAGSVWFVDADGDLFGDGTSPIVSCDMPLGTSAAAGDCDDDNPAINPAADEVCNGLDDDCDRLVDNDAIDASDAFVDADGDTFGDGLLPIQACLSAAGTSSNGDDCDDSSARVFPGADELCNGEDDDCDTLIDEEAIDTTTFYVDGDRDGFGDVPVEACELPGGAVDVDGDCDDADAFTYPGAMEMCDGRDNNCDGVIDDPMLWYRDADTDGYGSPKAPVLAPICAPPVGFVDDNTDCNDFAPTVNPGAAEVCDGLDNDCDTLVDEDAVNQVTWFTDADNDGFGANGSGTMGCVQPPGTVLVDGDCNDSRAAVKPGATETCDAVDQDCDGDIDEGPNTCPCPVENFNGKAYGFCENLALPWIGGELLCASFGYDLVSINTSTENAFVADSISFYDGGTDWWIGLTDDAVEGTFVWADGTLTNAYSNWEPGQPNDFFGQDCAEIDPNGTWNDEDCLFGFQPFVCESP